MDRSRRGFDSIVLALVLVAQVLSCLGGGLTICFEGDGTIRLEMPGAACCQSASSESRPDAPSSCATRPQDDCGPCADVRAETGSRSSEDAYNFEFAPVDLVYALVDSADASESRVFDLRREVTVPQTFATSLVVHLRW